MGPSAGTQAPNASQLTLTFTALVPAGAGAAAKALSAELEGRSATLLRSVSASHGPILISGGPLCLLCIEQALKPSVLPTR